MSRNVDRSGRPRPRPSCSTSRRASAHTSSAATRPTTPRNCPLDARGCGLLALRFPACTKLPGPLVPGTAVRHGARVPFTYHEFDPVEAAWDIGLEQTRLEATPVDAFMNLFVIN